MDHVPDRSVGDRVRVMDTNTARLRGISNCRGTVIDELDDRNEYGTKQYSVGLDNGEILNISGAMLSGC